MYVCCLHALEACMHAYTHAYQRKYSKAEDVEHLFLDVMYEYWTQMRNRKAKERACRDQDSNLGCHGHNVKY